MKRFIWERNPPLRQAPKLQLFEVWSDPTYNSLALSLKASINDQLKRGILSKKARRLYSIQAATCEEASAIFHLRQGFEPFVPQGKPRDCPECKAVHYPEGSGECWRCGENKVVAARNRRRRLPKR